MRKLHVLLFLLAVVSLTAGAEARNSSSSSSDLCFSDADCEAPLVCRELGGMRQCSHGNLFENWTWRETVCSLLTFAAAALAAGGGLGGGGIFVPLFVLILGLPTNEAVPLSQAMIFGGSMVNVIIFSRTKHPLTPDRSAIDYITVLMMEPLLLAGTIVGVILNVILPSWLLTTALTVTLVLTTWRTARKFRKTWASENRKRAFPQQQQGEGADGDAGGVEMTDSAAYSGVRDDATDASMTDDPNDPALFELQRLRAEDNRTIVWVAWIALVWLIVSVLSLLRGGKAGASSVVGIETCSPAYWALTVIAFPLLGGITWFIGKKRVRSDLKKRLLGHVPMKGDILWTGRTARVYPLGACVAGVMGGMLGIGGGMIMSPLLLELGMHSQSASATSALTVFLTASSAALQFILLDLLLLDYAFWFAGVSLLATIVGQYGIFHLVKKYQRASLIILTITIVLAAATVMMVTAGIVGIQEDIAAGRSMGFHSPC